MSEKNIIVMGNNGSELGDITEALNHCNQDGYAVIYTKDSQEALDQIRSIDEQGSKIALACIDISTYDNGGKILLDSLQKSHPRTKRMMFVHKDRKFDLLTEEQASSQVGPLESNVSLTDMIAEHITDYEKLPIFEFKNGDIKIKVADTLHEKKGFFALRQKLYFASKHLSPERQSPLQNALGLEWDEYDIDGIDRMRLDGPTQYVLAKVGGNVVGGARVIRGKCPMETGICISNGEEFGLNRRWKIGQPFNLDFIREEGKNTTEISRLVVDREYRKGKNTALIGVFRMVSNITKEEDYLVCTAKEKQAPLYQAIGFEFLGPRINYSLSGEWIPMLGDKRKAENHPETIPGMSVDFHRMITEEIPGCGTIDMFEDSKYVNKNAIRLGLYLNGYK